MNSESNNSPLNDLRCLWMTSGLVAYKLCNLEFDCDNCEFDKVFRRNSKSPPEKESEENLSCLNPVDLLVKCIREEQYDEKLIYLKNQLVVRKLFGNAYYLGINPLILPMLKNISSVKITTENKIKKGEIILSLEGEWGKKEFFSPADFLFIEKFQISPAGFNLNKWLGIFISNDPIQSQYNLNQWNAEKEGLIESIYQIINFKDKIDSTLADGGERIKYIHQAAGYEHYLRLLNYAFQ